LSGSGADSSLALRLTAAGDAFGEHEPTLRFGPSGDAALATEPVATVTTRAPVAVASFVLVAWPLEASIALFCCPFPASRAMDRATCGSSDGTSTSHKRCAAAFVLRSADG
jgi:hypothetical protein